MNINCYKERFSHCFCTVLIVLAVMLLSLAGSAGPCLASAKRPLVAILQIKSPDAGYSYVGPAITQMLETRLSSEGIDTFVVQESGQGSEAVELADFLITGLIEKGDRTFDAEIVLKDPGNGEKLKSWALKAVNLDVLAQDTGLLSVKLAETIKHAEDILKTPDESQVAENAQSGQVSDEFQMARLHPDKLVREQLVQDQEREKELERQKSAEERKRTELLRAQEKKNDETNWFPLPDVYDSDTDEPPEEEAEGQPETPGATSLSSQADETPEAVSQPGERENNKSWLSSLWPFGDGEEPEESWEKERDELKREQESNKQEAKVVPEEQLPYPPPPEINFDVPEPVPLDQALAKVDEIYVEKPAPKEEESWFSWLWPWGREEDAAMPEEKPSEKRLQAKLHDNEELQGGMDSMIQSISGHGPEMVQGAKEAVREGTKNSAGEGMEDTGISEPAGAYQEQYEGGEMLRQEHVHFGPRIKPEAERESPQEEAGAGKNMAFQESQGMQARLAAGGGASKVQDTVSQAPEAGLDADTGETEYAQEPAAVTAEQKELSNAGSQQKADNTGGPIWRWY